ncbi:unnamed protein product [Cladocopium goreaui]|uniref:Uncharacterized protein n=1 Tax=Cladocopium goreaui TaxID=2562237 RepID=A0A9P1GQB5_9DINO|nr:unnamed protein product [Cladocopium goreaui]
MSITRRLLSKPSATGLASRGGGGRAIGQARKVCSGGPYFLEYFHGEDGAEVHAFFEVDGEFYHAINPESTSVYLFKKLQVLQRIPTGETSDEEWFDMPDVTCSC